MQDVDQANWKGRTRGLKYSPQQANFLTFNLEMTRCMSADAPLPSSTHQLSPATSERNFVGVLVLLWILSTSLYSRQLQQ